MFLFDSLDAEMLFITYSLENSQIFHEIVKFWAAKTTKMIRILNLLSNVDVSKKNARFQYQCFDEKMTKVYFHPKAH